MYNTLRLHELVFNSLCLVVMLLLARSRISSASSCRSSTRSFASRMQPQAPINESTASFGKMDLQLNFHHLGPSFAHLSLLMRRDTVEGETYSPASLQASFFSFAASFASCFAHLKASFFAFNAFAAVLASCP